MPKPIIQGPYRTFRRLNKNESYLEFEGSTITVDLKARKPGGPWMHEELKLRAFMRLEIFPPYINNLGTREFQFIIRDWWLNGKSEMLSELFYDDPRGYWLGKNEKLPYRDYVPATVTFRVANHYEVNVDQDGVNADDLFAPARELEIRNLTSHDLRTWSPAGERGDELIGGGHSDYSLPAQRIYWEILPAEAVRKGRAADMLDEASDEPVILFHNKPPSAGAFMLDDDGDDPVSHLLAVGTLGGGSGLRDEVGENGFVARTPYGRGGHLLEALKVQQTGNVTLSPLYRPRRDLEIRWGLAGGAGRDALKDQLKSKRRLSGSIKIVSPSRSLGTADQGPLPGEPIDCCDFPARITYAINYAIAVNREEFVEDAAGIAIAVGVDDVPPRDVTVAFDKPHIGHVLKRYLEFGPGHCTGMHEITQAEFDHGVNFCRYWRTVPLDPDSDAWNHFEDFDPTRNY